MSRVRDHFVVYFVELFFKDEGQRLDYILAIPCT